MRGGGLVANALRTWKLEKESIVALAASIITSKAAYEMPGGLFCGSLKDLESLEGPLPVF